ncbi:MAG: archaellin/type IV pilin N-terminal domain-containing protein, partial [Candidatus Nanopusillus sp.]|nr:archaellin/type IV pilin N-terminal domain-containing protein [Candidatus Nanopusillus sp.]
MYIRSISPIIASILIIVITVAIAGIFYAFTSGMFGSLTQSTSQQIQQQSQMVSFQIVNIYCSNNTIYFNIYNSGNVPININNSVIIFTDNNGNTISINGSNIICNNGNIIPSRSSGLCRIINSLCYYDYIDYINNVNFIYSGVSHNYDTPNNNRFNIIYEPNYSIYLTVRIYNTQSIPTPSPFQQQIAICNGSINIGPNFAYVNNATLFNQIRPDGKNVYFSTNYNGTPNIYSWYLGQLINGSTYCKIWWVNIPNGIPANSNIVIYMAIGNYYTNYYQQYYPYVGASPQVDPSRRYDNGKYVFIAYGYFSNTMDGWTGHIFRGSFSPIATPNGIQMLNNQTYQGTYILPPNNWNIPLIPLIV